MSPLQFFRLKKRRLTLYIESIRTKSPQDKIIFLLKLITILSSSCGIPISDRNYKKPYWFSLFPGIIFMDYIIFGSYTVVYYAMDKNYLQCLPPVAIIGVSVPSIIYYQKCVSVTSIPKMQIFLYFGCDYIYPASKDKKLTQILDARANQLFQTLLKVSAALIIAIVIYIIYPSYLFVTEGAYPMPVPLLLPFTNVESTIGYSLILFNQIIIAVPAIIGNFAIEFGTAVTTNSMWGAADHINYRLEELAQGVVEGEAVTIRKAKLRNIFIQIQDLDRFTQVLVKEFFLRNLLQPCLATICIALAIFSHLEADWSSGIGYSIFSYTQLLILCNTGNEIRQVNESILASLWNCPWYSFTVSEQKDITNMICRLQNGCTMNMGPFAELNFQTATQITKTIYTYLAMMRKFRG